MKFFLISKKCFTFALAKQKRNVAQLVAHYVRDVGVGRSSRLIPTELVNNENCLPFCFIPESIGNRGTRRNPAQPEIRKEIYFPKYKHQTVLL